MKRLYCIAFLLMLLIVPNIPPTKAQVYSASSCGSWKISFIDQEPRITMNQVSTGTGNDCYGSVTFSNETSNVLGLGGYTLELHLQSNNAKAIWIPSQNNTNNIGNLTPLLELELQTIPTDLSSNGQISIDSAMTIHSFAIDTSIFILDTSLSLLPTGSCFVPKKEIALVALRLSSLMDVVAQRALKRDFVGAKKELSQVINIFLNRASNALKESGWDCVVDGLEKLIGKPATIASIVVSYLSWIPVVIVDIFRYPSPMSIATLNYIRKVFPTNTAINTSTPTNTLIPTNTPIPTLTNTPVSDSGEEIAFVEDGDIYLLNLRSKKTTRLTTNQKAGLLAWFPDGQQLIFGVSEGENTSIYSLQMDTKRESLITSNSYGVLAVSPSGKPFFNRHNPDTSVHDIVRRSSSGEETVVYSEVNGNCEIWNLSVHSDTEIALTWWCGRGGGTSLIDLTSGNQVYIADKHPDGTCDYGGVWAHTRPIFAFVGKPDCSSEQQTLPVYVLDITDPTAQGKLLFSAEGIGTLDWSPDDKWLVFDKGDGGIWVVSVEGGESKQISSTGYHPVWRP